MNVGNLSLAIGEIEEALLALPIYKGLLRESENLRRLSLFCAATCNADYLTLLNFSHYPDDLVKGVLRDAKNEGALEVGPGGRIVLNESFVRNRVRGAGALLDQLQGRAPVVRKVEAKSSEAPKGESKAAKIRSSVMTLCETVNGSGFGAHQIADHLRERGVAGIGGGDISTELLQLNKKGIIKCIQPGAYGKSALYIKGNDQQSPASDKPKEAKSKESRNTAAIMRKAIAVVSAQMGEKGFSWPEIAAWLRAEGYTEVEQFRTNYAHEASKMARRGELLVLEKGGGATKKPSVYALAPKAATAVAVVAPAPVAEVQAELMPGPDGSPANQLVETLQFMKARLIGDVEAITRTIGLLEREALR